MAYNYNHQRLITLILLMVWGCWILIADSKEKWDLLPQLGIAAICIFSLINLTQQMKEEINGMYSGGPEAATFINENIPADAVFITDNEPECSAILPFIKTKTFIYGGNGDEFSYVTWDDRWNQEIDYEGFNEIVRQYAQSGRPIYIISNWSWSCLDDPDRLQEDYELIFGSSENSVKGEEYYIYKVN